MPFLVVLKSKVIEHSNYLPLNAIYPMKKYIAKIVFNININQGAYQNQFDEQLHIIEAPNINNAYISACSIGKQEEEVFINENGEQVNWKFIDVSALYILPETSNAFALFTFTNIEDDPLQYINFIKQRALDFIINTTETA